MREDEGLVLRMDVLEEFPEGVPAWMIPLPVDELRLRMEQRREGFTRQGLDPADDGLYEG